MIIVRYVLFTVLVLLVAVPLYALPATLTLPAGPRPGAEEITVVEVTQQLEGTGKTGWDLVEAARATVAERMVYSRRNSFDSSGRAFERGYGYCTQHAYALMHLLTQLGFDAKVVQAFQNRFSDGEVTAHAWVSVKVNDEIRQIDSLFYDEQKSDLDFTPLSKVTNISPAFKLIAFWGGTAVNAHRYYLTGKDF